MASVGLARAVIAEVLRDFVIVRGENNRVFDYGAATEEVCFRLGVESGSSAGNVIDGMIVDAVSDSEYGPLPDSRLTPAGVGK